MKKFTLVLSVLCWFAFINFNFSQNHIEINPSNIDLGEWPIGAWQEPGKLYLSNSGFEELEISSSELIDANNVFTLHNISIPTTIPPFEEPKEIGISLSNNSIEEGFYSCQYQASCDNGNSVSSTNLMVFAYTPTAGDVFENAIEIDLPYSATNVSTSYPLRSNYRLLENANNGNDLVYKFELTEDVILDIELLNATSSSIIALYKEDFNGYDGPSFDNSIDISTNNSLESPLFWGVYYLVISNQTENLEFIFDLNITTTPMPIPGAAYNPYPANGATDVHNYGTVLQWEFPDYTKEYRILFGSTNPPEVVLDWNDNLDTSFVLPEMGINMLYNWTIEVRNSSGASTISNVWEFTTGLTPPLNLSATIIEVSPYHYNVELNWTEPSKALIFYNIYRDNEIMAYLIPGSGYFVDEHVSPNMDPCHHYFIEAFWDEGSISSDSVNACIPENGNIQGTLTNIETGELILGRALLNLASETGGINYTFESDYTNNSNYSYNVAVDNYTLTIAHPNYISEILDGIAINLTDTTTLDVALTPYPFEVDTVITEIINDTTLKIDWIPDSTFIDNIVSYEVYRKSCVDNSDWEFLSETNDLSYLDEEWNTLEQEEYKYAIKTVYSFLTSDFKESICNYTEPIVTVNIEVTTNSGDAPLGFLIDFTNLQDSTLSIQQEIGMTGMGTILEFHSGIYNLNTICPNFLNLEYLNVNINSDTTFVLTIETQPLQIKDLYVTPNGFATWNGGYPLQSLNYFEDFEDGIPSGWSIINGGNNDSTWKIINYPNFNNSSYFICNSLESASNTQFDEYLLSPIFNATMDVETILEWDQNYQNASNFDFFEVEVYDGINWIQVFYQDYDDNYWPEIKHNTIDITEYANSYLQVRFHYVANSTAWYTGLDNFQIKQNYGKSNQSFHSFNVWLNDVVVDHVAYFQDMEYNFEENDTIELIDGQTYITDIQAGYVVLGPKSSYEWTYQPTSSFPSPSSMTAYNMEGTNDMMIEWQNLDQLEILEISQEYGDPLTALYQNFESGYGVVYDFSPYPDAMINAIDFRHSSWGLQGEWEYKVHIIDWDTKTSLANLGPFLTTQNDGWEELVDVGEVLSGGASEIAIFIEPLGNTESNAYPRIDCDNSENAQGSIFGNLNDLNAFQPSTNGNFLMDVWIQTANGSKKVGDKQIPDYYSIGTNVYRNDSLLGFVPKPDSSFIDYALEPGYYDYCVATVYTADSGLHTWTSMVSEVCVNDVGTSWSCNPPINFEAEEGFNNDHAILSWNTPENAYETGNELLGYNIYRDGILIYNATIEDTIYTDYVDVIETCYEITAVYPSCGESDPTQEECVYLYDNTYSLNSFAKIFPNPAKDQVKIISESNISQISIFNQLGQLCYQNPVIQKSEYVIDIQNFESGIYLVEILSDQKMQKSKLIIK